MAKNYRPYNNKSTGAYGPSKPVVKKSGCKYVPLKDGTSVIVAWMVRKKIMVSYIVSEYKKTTTITSNSGKQWINLFAKASWFGGVSTCTAFKSVATGKIYLKDLHVVMNPKTNYCGIITKRK